MARNGSGTYSVPNTFTPNTTMSATEVNANFTDAGSEITNSLARDGQSSMTGPLKAADGSVGAPGISFGLDTNTGFRRASSDEMRWVAGSADVMYIDSVGKAWLLGAVDIAGALNLQGALSGSGVADLAAIEALSSTGALKRTGANTWALDQGTFNITVMKDNVGATLPTGVIASYRVPVACTLTGWTLLADQSGSIVIDVWRDTLANYPPTNADTITNGHEMAISSATSAEDTDISDWTDVTLDAGDVLFFNVDSVTDITRITICLTAKRFP